MLSSYNDIESDQPWDQIWEYVLGDEYDDASSRERTSSFRRYRSEESTTDAIEESFIAVEDTVLNMQTEKPETKRRLSFSRPSSFKRQSSNQRNSTTGSGSSFRLRGFRNRGRRAEEQDLTPETSSFALPGLSSVLAGADGDSKDADVQSLPKEQRRLSWKKSEAKPVDESREETILEAISSGFDGTIDESQEVVATLPKKEKRKKFLRFSKKKEDKTISSSNSGDLLFIITPSSETLEQTTPSPSKREKRTFFGKRRENKDSRPTETSGFISQLTLGDVEIGAEEDVNESQEFSTTLSRDKRRNIFRKRTSSSIKTTEDDRSDLESIEAMLGPWERREQSDNTGEKSLSDFSFRSTAPDKVSSSAKKPLKPALKKTSQKTDSVPLSLWQVQSTAPSTNQATKRPSLLKAVTKFGGKSTGKTNENEKSEQDLKRIVLCGNKAEDDTNPFYTNPVFLSSFSEDSSNQEKETVKKQGSNRKMRSRSKEKKAILDQDKGENEQTSSFLPQALLLLQSGIGVQTSASTESSKSDNEKLTRANAFNHTSSTVSATSVSISSSVSGSFSEQGQAKKSVKWADEVSSSDQESSHAGVSFAGIRKVFDPSWLYSMSSSDSDSSMMSSANQSSQSEDLSSVPTDSDVSMSGVSTTEKGDSDKEEQQKEVQLRFAPGISPDRINQLPPIDENESFRGSLGEDDQETFDTALAVANDRNDCSDSGTLNSILDKNEEAVHTRISVIQRKDGGTGEMTTIEPQGLSSPEESDTAPVDNTLTETSGESPRNEPSVETSKKNKSSDCVLPPPKRRPKKHRESRIPICRALRQLSDEDLVQAMESGIPVHELTFEELADIFPKIRMVADETSSDQASMVLGNSNSFDDSRPALFQVPSKAIRPALGLQSLYEYDFTSAEHMSVSYDSCGADPKSSLKVETHGDPPESNMAPFALIQVEASTISGTDCRTRRDGWFGNKRIELPNTPGVDIVGKVYRIDCESSKKTGVKKGDTVISLVSQGGNSRFLSVNPSSLVKIPEKIDPAEATCLVETYMTAFQTLHYNQSFLTRYRKTSLQGRTILIIGGMSAAMSRAMSQLAHLAGSKAIFATSRKKDFKFLAENGILPLSTDPVAWWEQLAGALDLLISLDEEVIPLHYKLLKPDGIVVVSSSEFHEDLMMYEDTRDPLKRKLACSTARSQTAARTSHYDLFEEWVSSPMKAKKDLAHLVELLEKRNVVPHVVDRVPLSKVAEIQDTLEKRRAPGHYVCEPWLVSKSRAVSL